MKPRGLPNSSIPVSVEQLLSQNFPLKQARVKAIARPFVNQTTSEQMRFCAPPVQPSTLMWARVIMSGLHPRSMLSVGLVHPAKAKKASGVN